MTKSSTSWSTLKVQKHDKIYLYSYIPCSTIYSNQDIETTQVSKEQRNGYGGIWGLSNKALCLACDYGRLDLGLNPGKHIGFS